MELVFAVISIILLVLYFKERSKNEKMESDYKYINARLLDVTNDDKSNYILIPSDSLFLNRLMCVFSTLSFP